MYPDNEKHTSFQTQLGVFCYTVMPFGLKNAGATYQCAMSMIFCDHLRKTMECYIDNIAIKSHDKLENDDQSHAGSPAKDKSDKVFLGSFKW